MTALAPHRFTVDEYYRMAETGILAPDARVELLEGEIIDMAPIGPFHSGTTNELAEFFILASQGRWKISVQTPLRLNRRSEPQPDLMLLHPVPGGYIDRHPTAEDVFLLIEVAQSSLDFDRSKKLPAYGKAGVPEVWIVNLEEGAVEVYREPHYLGYESKAVFQPGQDLSPAAFPDLKVDLAALLHRAR